MSFLRVDAPHARAAHLACIYHVLQLCQVLKSGPPHPTVDGAVVLVCPLLCPNKVWEKNVCVTGCWDRGVGTGAAGRGRGRFLACLLTLLLPCLVWRELEEVGGCGEVRALPLCSQEPHQRH